MDDSDLLNKQAVLVYLDGARDALQSAQFNLDGGYYGVAVNRAYYAFFYAATAPLLTLDVTRSKHSGVMAAFREYFVKQVYFRLMIAVTMEKPLSYVMSLTMKCWGKQMKLKPTV